MPLAHPRLRPRRTILFVPGDRPDRFEKACASGADAVCIDLEDAVAASAKARARAAALEFIGSVCVPGSVDSGPELILRINAFGSEAGALDLAALEESCAAPHALMLPKVQGPDDVNAVALHLETHSATGAALLPLIESAAGLHQVEAVACASVRVAALPMGGLDLAADLGAVPEWDSLLYARSRIVHAAALAGIAALDVPFTHVEDLEGLEREASRVRRLGFQGKMAIHPGHVPILHDVFTPAPSEVERARQLVEAADAAAAGQEGVFVVEGKMIDAPVVRAARATLARARSMDARARKDA
ncbi:MAG: CoA ester lyase [Gemmatimonadota bacterium]